MTRGLLLYFCTQGGLPSLNVRICKSTNDLSSCIQEFGKLQAQLVKAQVLLDQQRQRLQASECEVCKHTRVTAFLTLSLYEIGFERAHMYLMSCKLAQSYLTPHKELTNAVQYVC